MGPWTPAGIRSACEANGWLFEQDHPQTKGFSFRLDRELRVAAVFEPFPSAPAPHCSVLLYRQNSGDYPRGRAFEDIGQLDFDQAFESSLIPIVAELGRPEVEGSHEIGWVGSPRYHYAIWRGSRGLLALQQEEYDLYCGEFGVSVYLHPWEEGRPCPPLPLAVWGRTHQGAVRKAQK